MAGSAVDQMGEDIDAKPWLLAQMKPNAWRIAERNLRRQGFTVFNPLEKRTLARRGRFVNELAPLFPGYAFVQFDPASTPWRVINNTYGVTRVLTSSDHQPQVVPTALVGSIMARCDGEGCLARPEDIEPGTEVRITSGPFANFIVTVMSVAPNKRIWVMLEVMSRETRVLVDTATVMPTS
ncbi:MAG: transcription termination/antitermination NusG family protein [Devosia sp.]